MVAIKKILCCVDLSEFSPTVAEYAATLANKLGASVLCAYVAPSLSQYVGFHVPPSSIDSFVHEIVSGAEAAMDKFIEEYCQGAPCQGRIITGYAAEEILSLAASEDFDMIVMGTHGRKGIDRILFGSVAEKVVKSAKCPVLTIRPTGPVKD
jgi:nucleotide-binding universal stress UspA family protein